MRKPPIHRSFGNAIKGLILMLKSERNFQIEVLALLVNLFLIVYLKVTEFEATIILVVSFSVLSLEILNTCVEKICDIIQPDYDERIKIIKDMAAGSVFLMAIGSVVVGVLIYAKYLL
ncbi:diacylglycerol kinase family protein [Kaistella flava (ex Peng et al. 2021)]|uniref:Diacylglycerol kinase family protein n=1 Tax=Kaistella flava (ex Peng et al. 2021) TaxID=2038776 RepID=A0A7M2Y6A4_9FLAO|nr:diacylglycerol kinase family protein [Kaistella flava (ex Peng et al. 2021)]QOW09165.1 diacylglycerol kinase family protein [Kaistella flava (ex Peng et al. 2021)]